jgi:hypothetical protein
MVWEYVASTRVKQSIAFKKTLPAIRRNPGEGQQDLPDKNLIADASRLSASHPICFSQLACSHIGYQLC